MRGAFLSYFDEITGLTWGDLLRPSQSIRFGYIQPIEGNDVETKGNPPPTVQGLIRYAMARGERLSTVLARCELQRPQQDQRE